MDSSRLKMLLTDFRSLDPLTLISLALFIIACPVTYSVDSYLSLWLKTDDSVS